MKRFALLVFMVFLQPVVYGQLIFQKTVYDFQYGVQQIIKTNDGGYLGVGQAFLPNDTLGDIYLVKFNSTFDTVWSAVGGRQGVDLPLKVIQNPDSSYFVAGDFCCNASHYYDFMLYKFSPSGNLLWVKNYGTASQENIFDITSTASGGVILAGTTLSNIGYLVCVDSAGNVSWTRSISFGMIGSIRGITRTADNNFVVAGENSGPDSKIYVIKISASGNIIWSKIMDASKSVWAWKIEETYDRGFVIGATGEELTTLYKDFLIIKTDSLGNIEWSKGYGGVSDDAFSNILLTSDSAILATGASYSFWYQNGVTDGYAFKLNLNGDTIWTRVYGDTDGNGMSKTIETSDRGFAFVSWMRTGWTLVKTDMFGKSGCRENRTNTHIENYPLTALTQFPVIDSGGSMEIDSFHVSHYRGNSGFHCFAVSVQDMGSDQAHLEIYPNPTDALLNIESDFRKGTFQVHDVAGKLLINAEIPDSHFEIDLRNYVPGIYFLTLFSEGKGIHRKIIKQ